MHLHRDHADFPSGRRFGHKGENDTAKAPVDIRGSQKQRDCFAAILVDYKAQMPA